MPGLATRCTACGTVFRVVQDQLRVSDGWVRCGRCAEVFNAAEHLLDADSGSPLRLSAAAGQVPAPAPPASGRRDDVADGAPHHESAPAPHAARLAADDDTAHDARGSHAAQQSREPPFEPSTPFAPSSPFPPFDGSTDIGGGPAAGKLHDAARVDAAASALAGTSPRDAGAAAGDGLPASRDGWAPSAGVPPSLATSTAAPDGTPSFLRRAERVQRWRQPRVRAALWSVVLLAGLLLAGQVVHTWRDLVAARLPVLRPALEQACGWLQCSVGEAHAIDSLAVESSGLVRVEKSSVYRLQIALRNRAAIAVAVPAVEIALTDGQGKLLARRVLRAAELGASQPAVAAGRDLALQATLQAATEPVAGYTIELFYP